MNRIFLLFCICTLSATTSQAQTREVFVQIGFFLDWGTPTCSISFGQSNIDFGEVQVRNEEFTTEPVSTGISISGTNILPPTWTGVPYPNSPALSITNNAGDRIRVEATNSCLFGCGNTSEAFRQVNFNCDCEISWQAIIPAFAPQGTYTGERTVTATCI